MILILATGAAVASVLAYAAAFAFATRLLYGLAMLGTGVVLVLTFSVIDTLAALPSDALASAFDSTATVEVFAIVVCFEALLATVALWHSTSRDPRFASVLLLLPFPITTGGLLALMQYSMVHGPRVDLELLGWAGLLFGGIGLVGISLIARMVKKRSTDFLFELCLLLRLFAILCSAAMIATQLHRPVPAIEFEPVGLLVFTVIGLLLIGYGYYRRPQY